MESLLQALKRKSLLEEQFPILRSGFDDLDGSPAILRRGAVSLLGARPGMGRSTLAAQIATNVAEAGGRVCWFSTVRTNSEVVDKMLKFLNRKSSFADIKNCINSFIDVGINNISIDLMYSLPNQTLKDFMYDIDLVLTLPIKHISIYALTIEENTVFGRKGVKSQDDDIEADMYLQAIDKFEQGGFKQYEISNFAKEGYQSIHNLHYWHFDDFYGIGPGASGKIDNYLYDNTQNIMKYIQNPQSKDIMPFADKDEEMFEHIMMNLRLVEGIDIIIFNERYNIDIIAKYKKVIDDLLSKNLLSIEGNFLKCTKQGLPLLNSILTQFMD